MLLAGVLGLYAPIFDVPCLYGENNKKKKMTKSNKHHLNIEITSEQYVLHKRKQQKDLFIYSRIYCSTYSENTYK